MSYKSLCVHIEWWSDVRQSWNSIIKNISHIVEARATLDSGMSSLRGKVVLQDSYGTTLLCSINIYCVTIRD